MDRITAVNYLREHPELLVANRMEIVRSLKAAGIVARSTNHGDCNVESLVSEAGGDTRLCCHECGRPI